jgi:hypothetical protein
VYDNAETMTEEPASGAGGRSTGEVIYKVASTCEELQAAFRLVYRAYLRAGLGDPNPYQMRVTPYHLLPSTEVFVAVAHGPETHGEVISTVSLVMDGELGLPMELVYGREIAQRRERGLVLGEVTCLADRRRRFRRFFAVFCQLTRLLAQYARYQGVDQLVVAVHPKHARFYSRYMCFQPMGGLRKYPTVRDRPAVAMCLDLAQVDRERPNNYEKFFGQAIGTDHLQASVMSEDQRAYFVPMLDPSFPCVPIGDTVAETPAHCDLSPR